MKIKLGKSITCEMDARDEDLSRELGMSYTDLFAKIAIEQRRSSKDLDERRLSFERIVECSA